MDVGCGVAVDAFWGLVTALDARLWVPGGHRVRVDYDSPPAPGDTVLIYDGASVRVVVMDEVVRPFQPVWILGVVR